MLFTLHIHHVSQALVTEIREEGGGSSAWVNLLFSRGFAQRISLLLWTGQGCSLWLGGRQDIESIELKEV